ncbi:amidohydrolase family protein [Chloroflexota bacterium]
MIIDVHCHLRWENQPSKEWFEAQVQAGVLASGSSAEAVRERMRENFDTTGDLIVKDMDEAGIDISVIEVIDYSLLAGCADTMSLEESHKLYAGAAAKHPERLIAFAGIDPRRSGAGKFLEKAVKEWNMKGLKLMPAAGFYPNEPRCYQIYQKAVELGIPILVHTGFDSIPYYGGYAQPKYLDEVANDFPDLKIILAHAGGAFWQEAASMASFKPNIYLDLAMWQPKLLRNPIDEFYRTLRSLIDTAGRAKILMGSDWPGLRLVRKLPHAAWIKAIKEPPPEVKEAGIEFTEKEINGILGDNAARVLGLTKEG